ncbi:creatininase family protein [Ferroacidibacillus organovorans]|uniref:Uncharacterized protein n=1 Tax=Ferroacidibacillus organovorans TaxID=1765683 RepID=A0A853KE51_9BACL|nr:creatininase family protein [Ferroacidibacillus organovorans]KYP80966.1 hypothetical protein AYJ22_09600 [Ferroacidibacillus organovorans]OAG93670.1 hypothetical protein AYW79_09540 [Ferroacidibacillus organovorans]
MRFEELSMSDIKRVSSLCDTLVLCVGGLAQRNDNLPIGTSWMILRRIRDGIEQKLGGRALTMPLLPFYVDHGHSTFGALESAQQSAYITSLIRSVNEHVALRHLILCTDHIATEQAMMQAMIPFQSKSLQATSFVWWRDTSFLTSDPADHQEFTPELFLKEAPDFRDELSLLTEIAPRLAQKAQGGQERQESLATFLAIDNVLQKRILTLWGTNKDNR